MLGRRSKVRAERPPIPWEDSERGRCGWAGQAASCRRYGSERHLLHKKAQGDSGADGECTGWSLSLPAWGVASMLPVVAVMTLPRAPQRQQALGQYRKKGENLWAPGSINRHIFTNALSSVERVCVRESGTALTRVCGWTLDWAPTMEKKVKIVSGSLQPSEPLFIIPPRSGSHALKEFWLINKLHLSFKNIFHVVWLPWVLIRISNQHEAALLPCGIGTSLATNKDYWSFCLALPWGLSNRAGLGKMSTRLSWKPWTRSHLLRSALEGVQESASQW